MKILLVELTSLIIRGTCSSPCADKKAKINITLDKDGCGYDAIEKIEFKQALDSCIKQDYKYLISLENLNDIDSKDDILIQISDLYASSINNVFSNIKTESETAKTKKKCLLNIYWKKLDLRTKSKHFQITKTT